MGYKLWVISSIIFLSFLQTGCPAQVKDNPTDKLVEVQDPYSWDFGQIKEGEVVKHVFVLKNESEETLTIKEVNTSCGCTASKVEKKILLPAESTEIEVKFNSKGYSGLAQQYVYVHTDSLDASTSLSINGERPSTSLGTSPELAEGRSRTIDNSIIRFIIKAEVIKSKEEGK